MIEDTAYYYLSGVLTGVLVGAVLGVAVSGVGPSTDVLHWIVLPTLAISTIISLVYVVGRNG